MTKLIDIAKTIRSKNAGVDKITFDIIFSDEKSYNRVCKSQAITRAKIAKLYNIKEEIITDFVEFAPANAIKFSVLRDQPSGSAGDSDIFGAQQYAPLMDIEIPD